MKLRLILFLTAAAALTIAPAIVEGLYLNRWGAPADLESAAAQMKQFPSEFGNWKLVSEGEPLSDGVCKELGVAGYVTRNFENRETGATVSLLLMVGQPGPLLRHPPNICYANRANRQVGEITKFRVAEAQPKAEFDAIEYEPPDAMASNRFMVAYAMSTGDEWSVPRFPRLEYGATPKLYKVQMLSILTPPLDRAKGIENLQQFATEFCAAFHQQR
jgi:hypothetical protein